jgi:hypothetical protein
MTDATPPESTPEPSMEEILASIRQIISEDLASVAAGDGRPTPEDPRAGGPRVGDDDDVLVLTERAPAEPSPFAPPREDPPEARAAARSADPRPAEAQTDSKAPPHTEVSETDTPDTETSGTETPGMETSGMETIVPDTAAPEPVDPESEPAGRSLTVARSVEPAVVDPKTVAVVAASFERLSFVVENTPPPPPFNVSPGGATLEDITRDILTPVIKAWLDENLPAIVRARVDEEVERITRSRVR